MGLAVCVVVGWMVVAVFGGLLLGFPDFSNPGELVGYLFFTLLFGGGPGAVAYVTYWRVKHPRESQPWTREDSWRVVIAGLIAVAVGLILSLLK